MHVRLHHEEFLFSRAPGCCGWHRSSLILILWSVCIDPSWPDLDPELAFAHVYLDHIAWTSGRLTDCSRRLVTTRLSVPSPPPGSCLVLRAGRRRGCRWKTDRCSSSGSTGPPPSTLCACWTGRPEGRGFHHRARRRRVHPAEQTWRHQVDAGGDRASRLAPDRRPAGGRHPVMPVNPNAIIAAVSLDVRRSMESPDLPRAGRYAPVGVRGNRWSRSETPSSFQSSTSRALWR